MSLEDDILDASNMQESHVADTVAVTHLPIPLSYGVWHSIFTVITSPYAYILSSEYSHKVRISLCRIVHSEVDWIAEESDKNNCNVILVLSYKLLELRITNWISDDTKHDNFLLE